MKAKTGKILIGGGTGFIGTHLCKLLKEKGYACNVVSRMPGPRRITWHELQNDGLPDGTKAVVNLAGQNVMDPKQRWNAGFKQNVFNSRISTTTALAKAIKQAEKPPGAFITMSGVGIYKPHNVTEYTEESDSPPFDFLSQLCVEWEKAALLPPEVPCRRVTIRSGVVIGRDGGMIKNLYLPFSLGLGGRVGDGKQYLPWIHINDLTRLILCAIENDKMSGTFNGVAPQQVTNLEFTKAFAKALNRPAFFPVPKVVLNVLLHKERAYMLTEGQKVSSKKLQSTGFQFNYPDILSACQEVVT